MSKYIVRHNSTSYSTYYVQGRGFVGTKATATKLESSEADGVVTCARNMGNACAFKEQAVVSFGVCYIRPEDINSDGSIKQNAKNPSRRRFSSRSEANTHGRRFDQRTKKNSTELAGHVGFYVIETSDPVNAYINPETGLTNSL